MTWDKVATTIKKNGEKTITYRKVGNPNIIESRREAIPHANRSGVWFRTTYFLMKPDGTEEEYYKLTDAKAAAEKVETPEAAVKLASAFNEIMVGGTKYGFFK